MRVTSIDKKHDDRSCRCEACCPQAPRYTDTQEYKILCLARYIARRPTREERQAHLRKYRTRAGDEAWEIMRSMVAEIFEADRAERLARERKNAA